MAIEIVAIAADVLHPLLLASALLTGKAIGIPDLQPSLPPARQLLSQEPAVAIDATTRARLATLADLAAAQQLDRRSYGDIVQAIAEALRGTPYAAGLLDAADTETLVATLDRFDCVLFVEAVLAVARGVATRDLSPSRFATTLADLRYRDGTLDGYCSRLHYFSEWIDNNSQRHHVIDLTHALGGIASNHPLDFMSRHRSRYKQLRNPATYTCLKAVEARLANLPRAYIPTHRLPAIAAQVRAGDIIAIATAVPGLDVTHTGIAYRTRDGRLGLIHASPSGSVTIAPDLQAYVQRVPQAIGVTIARPIDPRQPPAMPVPTAPDRKP